MWRVSGFLLSDHSIRAHIFQLWKPGLTQQHEYLVSIMQTNTTAVQYILPSQSLHTWMIWILYKGACSDHYCTCIPRFMEDNIILMNSDAVFDWIITVSCVVMVFLQNQSPAQNGLCSTVNHDKPAVHLNNRIPDRTAHYKTSCSDLCQLHFIQVLFSYPSVAAWWKTTLTCEYKSKRPRIKLKCFGSTVRYALFRACGKCLCHACLCAKLFQDHSFLFFLAATF